MEENQVSSISKVIETTGNTYASINETPTDGLIALVGKFIVGFSQDSPILTVIIIALLCAVVVMMLLVPYWLFKERHKTKRFECLMKYKTIMAEEIKERSLLNRDEAKSVEVSK